MKHVTSGVKTLAAELGSKLIRTPLNQRLNTLWNTAVNIAIHNKDIDTLIDMNQISLRESNSKEYYKAMEEYVNTYINEN